MSVVTDYGDIAGYGIMKTPGLVVDEEVLVYGRVPKPAEIAELLPARSPRTSPPGERSHAR